MPADFWGGAILVAAGGELRQVTGIGRTECLFAAGNSFGA
jgi:hypothetical protein